MKRTTTRVVFAALLLAPAIASGAGEKAVEILGAKSPMRVFLVAKSDQSRLPDGTLSALRRRRGREDKDKAVFGNCVKTATESSAPPPADWTALGFDDSSWPMTLAPVHTSPKRMYGLLCARLRLVVDDPAAARDVKLSLAYRGGVVVHLNGRELSRGHMPEGEITLDTPALDYPKEAYLDPDGFLMRTGFGDPGRYAERFALRDRRHEVAVPASRLVDGVNVLALELHRPLLDLVFYSAKPRRHEKNLHCQWETLNLTSVRLSAAEPLTARRPPALRVWNAPPAARLRSDLLAEAFEPVCPVRIHGCRNGGFCGVLMAGSNAGIKSLRAAVGEVTGPGGAFPADRISLRFGVPDGAGDRWFDGLMEAPPASIPVRDGVACRPVWVEASVPAELAAGVYKGTISVAAEGAEAVAVPLEISVADWTLPDVSESPCWWWLVQSPESLSRAYNVPMWSKEHLELIGRSFDLMRETGTRVIYMPIFARSHLGNEHSMIRWYRQGGAWTCDFSVFDKYLETAVKHLRKLDVVCIYVFGSRSESDMNPSWRNRTYKRKPLLFPYTQVDPKTGKLTEAEGPTWDQTEAIQAFLKPAFEGIRQRLDRPGIAKNAMMLGVGNMLLTDVCKNALKPISGGAKWVYHCHPYVRSAGYATNVWGAPTPNRELTSDQYYGWKLHHFRGTHPRDGSYTVGTIRDYTSPVAYRVSLESAALCGMHGFGWCGADFWPLLKGVRGRSRPILDMYPLYDPRGNNGILHTATRLLRMGRGGPEPTARQRMIRAGLQEVQARALIDKALLDPAKKAALGADVVKRCERLLHERLHRLLRSRSGRRANDTPNEIYLLQSDLEAEAGRLFALAAEVAGKLRTAGKQQTPLGGKGK